MKRAKKKKNINKYLKIKKNSKKKKNKKKKNDVMMKMLKWSILNEFIKKKNGVTVD